MHQKCDCKVEDILLERDVLQRPLDSTASQLSGVCSSLTTGLEGLEQHRGHSPSSHLLLKSLLASSVFNFDNRVDRLVNNKVSSHCARFSYVVNSAFESLEMDPQSIVELLRAAYRGGRMFTASPETLESLSFMPLVPRIDIPDRHVCTLSKSIVFCL